eukprot:1180204-Prorocentrum_minimum.AAC.2
MLDACLSYDPIYVVTAFDERLFPVRLPEVKPDRIPQRVVKAMLHVFDRLLRVPSYVRVTGVGEAVLSMSLRRTSSRSIEPTASPTP